MAYYIQYNPDKSVEFLSETYYNVVLVTQSDTIKSNQYEVTQQQYDDWLSGLTSYHYINSANLGINTAYYNNAERKIVEDANNKSNIISRMIEINQLIPVYTDLGLSVTDLLYEYSQLIAQ